MFRLYHTIDYHVAPETYDTYAAAQQACQAANAFYRSAIWGIASTQTPHGKTSKLTPVQAYQRDRIEQRNWEKRLGVNR